MGVINQQGRDFTHGFEIHLENATLHYELAVLKGGLELMPLKVLPANGKVLRPKLGGGDMTEAFVGEIQEVVRCVGTGRSSETLCGDLARDAIVLCHKQAESVKKGRIAKI
jgi:hypothetical protein